jgi:hypothetical protein
MFNVEEIKAWEEEQAEKLREVGKYRRAYDPVKERLFKARKKHYWRYPRNGNESTVQRKMYQESFRAKMKDELRNERYHTPVPHEYKTYGWHTW